MECKNPHIDNFCGALIEKKEPNLDSDAKDKLRDDLYRLFENMLGRNMVAALSEEKRSQFVSIYDKGNRQIDYDQIAEFFSDQGADSREVMKQTMNEFTAIYFKNR
jgi:hypothetical protein